MLDGGSTNWVQNLPIIILVDQLTVRISISLTFYYICCNSKLAFPIEHEVPTWQILSWGKVYSSANLLAMRARQLQRQDNDLEKAILHLQCIRLKTNKRHNLK